MSSRVAPVKRSELITRLKRLGFEGPFSGGKHQFLVRGSLRLILPNPHKNKVGVGLVTRILSQARVERED